MTSVETHSPGTISWFDVQSPDPDRAREFYAGLFGWTFERSPVDGYTLCMLRGRLVAGLSAVPPGAPYPSAWSIYFSVADADAAVARVREHRGQVLMDPTDVGSEGRLVFCLDPTGAGFGVWQPRNHRGAGIVDEPGAMIWAELRTRDAGAARRFYGAAFDLDGRESSGFVTPYWVLGKKDRDVCGVQQMSARTPSDVAPQWMPYFAVGDVDATVVRARDLGGTLAVPAFDTPAGRVATVDDPWGASFNVLAPRT
jgi:uncharacterized protein